MTVKELRDALLGLPDDTPVKVADRLGPQEGDIDSYLSKGSRLCSLGHLHDVTELWIRIYSRFKD